MNSRWDEAAAREAVARWGGVYGEAFALRLYSARLLGADPALVLHGGGNVSVKGTARSILGEKQEVFFVKASGHDLAVLEPQGLPGMDLAYLRRLRALTSLDDVAMVREIRRNLLDPDAPTPSIETLLHAFLPHGFVDHSHADAVLVLTNQQDGEKWVREALGTRVAWVPYVRPGFELAKAVADAVDANPHVEGVVLAFHGLVTFGEDARSAYERHIALVDACERFIADRLRGSAVPVAGPAASDARLLAARAAPVLRGLLAYATGDEDHPYQRSIMEWRATTQMLAFVNSPAAARLCATGPLTTDHLIRTRPWPMFVAEPEWNDADALRRQLAEAVAAYRDRYRAYLRAGGVSLEAGDASPRVVLLGGAGVFAFGPTRHDAVIAADIAEQTFAAKWRAEGVGSYTSLSDDHLIDMEYRDMQQRKLGAPRGGALSGQVVVISGGAGAIGAAVAEECLIAGAHAALADRDEARLARAVAELAERYGAGRVMGVTMDVTDEASVQSGFDRIVLAFGGLDVVVPNAGVAHVAAIEQIALADFERVMKINATGYLLFMQAGIRVLKAQGLGGHIVVNASKNVFAPGKDFAAYSASKSAAHQLGRVAAIELASYGIRVNMINADAVFGDEANPSGLWQEVGPARAKSRNIPPQKLPDYYRERNLLKTAVRGRHVGRAVVFFASNATPTTGATLPVDGGISEAFPR